MTKSIQPGEAVLQPIRDTSASLAHVEPARVQEGLGADASVECLEEALAPVTLFALREELGKRLQSSGGRPALAGVTRRAKIPLSDEEWLRLEELAAAVSSPGFAPSAGQVASVLLTLSLQSVAARTGSGQPASPVIHELAGLVAGASAQGRTKQGS